MADASARTHTPEPIKKLMQLQIERLKKEDDEEQWISGEELYTEGSSDEDDTATRVKRKGREERSRMHRKTKDMRDRVDIASIRGKHMHKKDLGGVGNLRKPTQSCSILKEAVVHDEEEQKEKEELKADTQEDCRDRLAESEDVHASADPGEGKSEECDEASGGATLAEPEISWRPKRGSIKLPSLNYEGRLELVSNSQVQ